MSILIILATVNLLILVAIHGSQRFNTFFGRGLTRSLYFLLGMTAVYLENIVLGLFFLVVVILDDEQKREWKFKIKQCHSSRRSDTQ